MTEDEYKECKYIDTEMRFYTFEEFKSNARAIKRMYDTYVLPDHGEKYEYRDVLWCSNDGKRRNYYDCTWIGKPIQV